LSKGRNFTIQAFDIVAVCGNKVECCFDNVAGVDGALVVDSTLAEQRQRTFSESPIGLTINAGNNTRQFSTTERNYGPTRRSYNVTVRASYETPRIVSLPAADSLVVWRRSKPLPSSVVYVATRPFLRLPRHRASSVISNRISLIDQ